MNQTTPNAQFATDAFLSALALRFLRSRKLRSVCSENWISVFGSCVYIGSPHSFYIYMFRALHTWAGGGVQRQSDRTSARYCGTGLSCPGFGHFPLAPSKDKASWCPTNIDDECLDSHVGAPVPCPLTPLNVPRVYIRLNNDRPFSCCPWRYYIILAKVDWYQPICLPMYVQIAFLSAFLLYA